MVGQRGNQAWRPRDHVVLYRVLNQVALANVLLEGREDLHLVRCVDLTSPPSLVQSLVASTNH